MVMEKNRNLMVLLDNLRFRYLFSDGQENHEAQQLTMIKISMKKAVAMVR